MRMIKFSGVFVVCVSAVLITGCVSEQQYNQLKLRNDRLSARKAQLESEVQTIKMQLDELQRKLDTADARCGIDTNALRETIAALEEDLARKKDLLASMRDQCLGGAPLPPELSTMLEEFASGQEMVTYDASRGIVKFKSDLTFELGSAVVASNAAAAVGSLCGILNSEQGQKFDIIIAGHTDDVPIGKDETRAKHPTNWHLSVHRAIAVLQIMAKNNVVEERMSARGFGEFRPIAPNAPGNKGNPLNRRVEIYIVSKGT